MAKTKEYDNPNDYIFEGMTDTLIDAITDARDNTDHNDTVFIHISHCDQDGYGCTMITKLCDNGYSTSRYVDDVLDGTNRRVAESLINPNRYKNVHYYNTYKMMPDLMDDVSHMIEMALINQYHRHIVVLISDLGNITVDVLVERFRDANHGDIKFIIVDHHRSIYQEQEATCKVTDKYMYTLIHEDTDTTLIHYASGPYFEIYMFLGWLGQSATKMLEFMLTGYLPIHTGPYASLVSIYDTGKAGNWYIPPERVDNDQFYKDQIAPEVKLWNWWNHIMDQPYSPNTIEDRANQYFAEMGLTLLYGEKASIFAKIAAGEIRRDIQRMAVGYMAFIGQVQCLKPDVMVSAPDDDYVTYALRTGIQMKVPKDMDVRPENIFVHGPRAPRSPKFPFTFFAKQFMNDHPEAYIVANIRQGDNAISIDMRGNTDHVNLYKIAKLNGGGGHPGAAGFSVPLK